MGLKYTMDDGYFGSWDLVNRDVARMVPFRRGIGQKEEVAAIKRWFHGTANTGIVLKVVVLNDKSTSYLSTTTIGDSVLVISPKPFHIMSPDAMTEAKFRT